jgi:hypothetical protein
VFRLTGLFERDLGITSVSSPPSAAASASLGLLALGFAMKTI